MEDSQRLSEHIRYIHDSLEEADIEYVLGLLDSWATEIRLLEDEMEYHKGRAYTLDTECAVNTKLIGDLRDQIETLESKS